MGNYSKQTYHENVQANRQKSLDYENELERILKKKELTKLVALARTLENKTNLRKI